MFEKLKNNRNVRYAMMIMAAIAIVAIAFSFAPVRALASNFLSLFRVEQFAVVEIDPERVEEIAASIPEDAYFGEFEVLGEGSYSTAESVADAEAAAGFDVLVPEGYGDPATIMVSGGDQLRFTPDIEGLREIFSAIGLDPELLPQDIDGEPFDVDVPVGVSMVYGEEGDGFMIHQSPSPELDVPDGVDVQALGEAMFVLLGVSPDEAARLSQEIDWATTLVLPIPRDLAVVREVKVNGATGLLFEPISPDDPDMPHRVFSLLWSQDGYVYMINGADGASVMAVAESLK